MPTLRSGERSYRLSERLDVRVERMGNGAYMAVSPSLLWSEFGANEGAAKAAFATAFAGFADRLLPAHPDSLSDVDKRRRAYLRRVVLEGGER